MLNFRSEGDPVLFLSNPPGVKSDSRRDVVNTINSLNRIQLADIGDPEIATRISQYELSYRMQTSVPELMDLSSEPGHIHELYGTRPWRDQFCQQLSAGTQTGRTEASALCKLFDQGWDTHANVFKNLYKKATQIDQPIAALVRDLKQRGLLDQTLVVWSAEFGRTPFAQTQEGKLSEERRA